jgi:hypothetical protein
MNEKAPNFDRITTVDSSEEQTRFIKPKNGPVNAEIAEQYEEWYQSHQELKSLPADEKLDVIKQWFLDHEVEVEDNPAKIFISKFPLKQIANELKEQGLNPFDFIRWCAGPGIGISKLAQAAEQQGLDPSEYYVDTDANLEFGYNLYPKVGEPALDGSHLIEEGENLVSGWETIHKHMNTQETYVVFAGATTIRIHITTVKQSSNNPSKKNQIDGEDINLDLTKPLSEQEIAGLEQKGIKTYIVDGNAKALSYQPPVNDYHTTTFVSPGADFLVIKSPSKLWDKNSGESWNDKFLYPIEKEPEKNN